MARALPIGRRLAWAACALALLGAGGCAGLRPAVRDPGAPAAAAAITQTGRASYYARAHHGRRTASGERFDMHALTAAHRSLPFGTRVRVTNLANGRQAVVRINDRGPFRRGRILDVSWAAARLLGLTRSGTARVRLETL